MSARLRLGLVGAGVMGSYHARVISQSDRCELTVIADPDAATGQRMAGRYGTRWQPEVDDFGGLDAVIVAAPTEAHPPLVLRALDAGLPVLVEKPVSSDLAQTEALVNAAESRQIPLMCGFVERFNPALRTVLPLVVEPLHVTAVRHSPYANRNHSGVASDLLIHDVDACLRLVGMEPVKVRSSLGFYHPTSAGGEDVAEAVLMFGSGAVATASASRVGQRKIRTMSIAELNRTIEIDLLRRDVTIYRHVSADLAGQDSIGYRQQTIIEIPQLVSAQEPLVAQLDHFIDLIEGRIDPKEERESILPPHRVVAAVMSDAG